MSHYELFVCTFSFFYINVKTKASSDENLLLRTIGHIVRL